MPVRIVHGNKAPEEMALPIPFDSFYEIVIKLLAVFGLPVIVSLVDRNHKTLI